MKMIFETVKKTGRVVIAHDGHLRYGPGAEIAAHLAQVAHGMLKAPIVRCAAPDKPIPYAPALEKNFIPDAEVISRAILNVCEY